MNSEELAQRAVACPHWEWLPGMLAIERAVPGMALSTSPVRVDGYWHNVGVWTPDLTDPATLGCFLTLVREAWGMPTGITVSYSDDTSRWVVSWSGATHGGVCGEGATEAEALVAALEAAP